MNKLLFLLLLGGCIHQPSKPEVNWLKIYEQELIIARENGDADAWRFFFPEYLKELNKQHQ